MRKDKAGNELNEYGFRKDFNFDTRFDLKTEVEGYLVSTVDLGLDHSFGDGPPLYYETMIFAKDDDDIDYSGEYQERYVTEAEARKGHEKAIKYVKEKLLKGKGKENE